MPSKSRIDKQISIDYNETTGNTLDKRKASGFTTSPLVNGIPDKHLGLVNMLPTLTRPNNNRHFWS